MVRGTVGSSGVQSAGGGVLGGLGVAAGNLPNTMSGLNGINPVWRKAERMVVRLNVREQSPVLSRIRVY